MQLTRNTQATSTPGPSDWFTGAVLIDAVAAPQPPSRVVASLVHFAPGARTAWHTHPLGQTMYVIEGLCLCSNRDGTVERLGPGDRMYFEPGEEHWHGATLQRFMTHLAIQEVDESGAPVTWGAPVTDAEYAAAAA
ncbi:MAG TPA: cupin domain-containing protein [Solirubrobacteraceae bacterium]|jgi:quercetin dioxygenase-like cupin family protein|nr:cupin domain-containing protein [Solirubrobacteraceae bacterium]